MEAIFRTYVSVPGSATIDDVRSVEEFLRGLAYPKARGGFGDGWEVDIEVPLDDRAEHHTKGQDWRAGMAFNDSAVQGIIDAGNGLSEFEAGFYVARRLSEINDELQSRGWDRAADVERVQ